MDSEYYAGLIFDDRDYHTDGHSRCKYCGSEISWDVNDEGKFTALTPAKGEPHVCKKRTAARQQNQLNSMPLL